MSSMSADIPGKVQVRGRVYGSPVNLFSTTVLILVMTNTLHMTLMTQCHLWLMLFNMPATEQASKGVPYHANQLLDSQGKTPVRFLASEGFSPVVTRQLSGSALHVLCWTPCVSCLCLWPLYCVAVHVRLFLRFCPVTVPLCLPVMF